jgi:hypothetical protein
MLVARRQTLSGEALLKTGVALGIGFRGEIGEGGLRLLGASIHRLSLGIHCDAL